MKVQSYLAILVISCLVGGYMIEYVLGEQHKSVQAGIAQHNADILAAKDFGYLRDNVAQLLVSGDLVIGAGESYLAAGALDQSRLLSEQFSKLLNESALFYDHASLRNLFERLASIQSLLRRSMTFNGEDRDQQLGELLVFYDRDSAELVKILEETNTHVKQQLDQNEIALETLKGLAQRTKNLTIIVFSITVFGLWYWANRQISRPLSALSSMAGRAQSGEPFEGVSDAPKEVLVLSNKITSLTNSLSFQAIHDPLTDLYNRREFERQLELTLDRNQGDRAKSPGTACYIDLDHFKVVNDSCGHAAGDELLIEVSKILQKNTRLSDIVARLGGDEFGIVFRRCTLEDAENIAERIRRDVDLIRYQWGEESFSISASIGLCEIPGGENNLATVINAVDAACAAAKQGGRNRVYVLQDEDAGVVEMRNAMLYVNQINNAIIESRFELFYQDIVSIQDNSSTGNRYEVLLRMLDKKDNLVVPCDFLPLVERYQMGARLDLWVVNEVITRLLHDKTALGSLESCSINLSGQSLSDLQFLSRVEKLLDETGFPCEKLCFEITETAAISNLAQATEFIGALRKRQVRFALDDFGSGHSSFGYLRSLPVDYVKIDGSFVKGMLDDELDSATVRSITEVAKAAGKLIIAEYVENEALAQALTDLGVDYGQGYFYGKPIQLPLDSI